MSGHKTRQKFIGTKFCSGFVFHLSYRTYFNLTGKHPELYSYILKNVSLTLGGGTIISLSAPRTLSKKSTAGILSGLASQSLSTQLPSET